APAPGPGLGGLRRRRVAGADHAGGGDGSVFGQTGALDRAPGAGRRERGAAGRLSEAAPSAAVVAGVAGAGLDGLLAGAARVGAPALGAGAGSAGAARRGGGRAAGAGLAPGELPGGGGADRDAAGQ